MEAQNPFISLLNQVVELMELIQNQTKLSPKIPEDLVKDIKLLKEKFKKIEEFTRSELRDNQKDSISLRIETMNSSNMSEKDKKMLERALHIKRDMQMLKKQLNEERKKANSTIKKKNTSDSEDQANKKKRRKLFKPLGGERDWIPL